MISRIVLQFFFSYLSFAIYVKTSFGPHNRIVRMEIEWSSGGFFYKLEKFNKEEWTDPIGGLLSYGVAHFLNVKSKEHYI